MGQPGGDMMTPGIPDPPNRRPENDFSCQMDADCSIKNVGNCCGAYPRCADKDFESDLDAVRRCCAGNGVGGACGFPDIDECKCVDNSCVSFQDGNEV